MKLPHVQTKRRSSHCPYTFETDGLYESTGGAPDNPNFLDEVVQSRLGSIRLNDENFCLSH